MKTPKHDLVGKLMLPMLLAGLLAAWTTAAAQAPPAVDPAPPCDPVTEPCDDASSEPEAGAGADPALEEDGMPDPDLEGGPQAAVEEDPAIEASADEVFTPGDEISEDYPIPLPADI